MSGAANLGLAPTRQPRCDDRTVLQASASRPTAARHLEALQRPHDTYQQQLSHAAQGLILFTSTHSQPDTGRTSCIASTHTCNMFRSLCLAALLSAALASDLMTYPFGQFNFRSTTDCPFYPVRSGAAPPHPPRLEDPCDHMKCPKAPGQCYEGVLTCRTQSSSPQPPTTSHLPLVPSPCLRVATSITSPRSWSAPHSGLFSCPPLICFHSSQTRSATGASVQSPSQSDPAASAMMTSPGLLETCATMVAAPVLTLYVALPCWMT